MSALEQDGFAEASHFRNSFYGCLSARADAFFELTDALLRADGPVKSPVELSLLAEHRRRYGSLYGALDHGRLDVNRLRDLLVRCRVSADGSCPPWTSPVAAFGRRVRAGAVVLPRPRPLQGGRADHPGLAVLVAARTPDRTSWTAGLDAVRLGPADDAAAVTAAQLRDVAERLIASEQWHPGDRDMTSVLDACYDVMRLAWAAIKDGSRPRCVICGSRPAVQLL